MNHQNFKTVVTVEQSPEHVFESINNVRGWWSQEIEGSTDQPGAKFSYHHQAVDQLGDGLIISARSDDGAVEAIELEDAASKGWMVAVQWHPERTASVDSAQQALFDELARQALDFAANR